MIEDDGFDRAVNAQMNASGQSNPPVAIAIQLAALTAEAYGCPHFRASWPGNFPRLTTMATPAKISTAKTTKANASKAPNVTSIAEAPAVAGDMANIPTARPPHEPGRSDRRV